MVADLLVKRSGYRSFGGFWWDCILVRLISVEKFQDGEFDKIDFVRLTLQECRSRLKLK